MHSSKIESINVIRGDKMQRAISLREYKYTGKDSIVSYQENYQILYILQGKGKIHIENRSEKLSQQNLIFIPPKTEFTIQSNQKLTILSLVFDDSRLEQLNQKILKDKIFKSSFILLHEYHNTNIFKAYLKRLMSVKIVNKEQYFYRLNIYLAEILLDIHDKKTQIEFENANELRYYQIKDYIDTHYFELDNMDVLSKQFNLTERYISQIFKQYNHLTPNQYLINKKIEVSKSLLKETDSDITTICFKVGFNSISSFYRHFKKIEGIAPSKYRQVFQMI